MPFLCPQCQEVLISINLGGTTGKYCENCGYPEEDRPENPACVICGLPGVGVCGVQWRCEDHWRMAEESPKCQSCGKTTVLHKCGDGSVLLCGKCLSTCIDM